MTTDAAKGANAPFLMRNYQAIGIKRTAHLPSLQNYNYALRIQKLHSVLQHECLYHLVYLAV